MHKTWIHLITLNFRTFSKHFTWETCDLPGLAEDTRPVCSVFYVCTHHSVARRRRWDSLCVRYTAAPVGDIRSCFHTGTGREDMSPLSPCWPAALRTHGRKMEIIILSTPSVHRYTSANVQVVHSTSYGLLQIKLVLRSPAGTRRTALCAEFTEVHSSVVFSPLTGKPVVFMTG